MIFDMGGFSIFRNDLRMIHQLVIINQACYPERLSLAALVKPESTASEKDEASAYELAPMESATTVQTRFRLASASPPEKPGRAQTAAPPRPP